MKKTTKICYVKHENGDYFIQQVDAEGAVWLHSDDQSWEGGFGRWETVSKESVPAEVRARLDWVLEEKEEEADE